MTARATQPAFRAYTVVNREGQSDFWIPIGAAFDTATDAVSTSYYRRYQSMDALSFVRSRTASLATEIVKPRVQRSNALSLG